MKIKLTLIVAVGLAILSCSTGRNSENTDEISGRYVREYSFKVKNLESGNEIGMRTIRDTIFIRSLETGYEVSNNKWRLNDYDKEGWQDMTHADDRPMPTFQVSYNASQQLLSSENSLDLFLDLERGEIFKDKSRVNPYKRVR